MNRPMQEMLFPTAPHDGETGSSGGGSNHSNQAPAASSVVPVAAGGGNGEDIEQGQLTEHEEKKKRAYVKSLLRINVSTLVFTSVHVLLWTCEYAYRIAILLGQAREEKSFEEWMDCAFRNFDSNEDPSAWTSVCGTVPKYRVPVASMAADIVGMSIYGALISLMHFSSMMRHIMDSEFMWDLYDCILSVPESLGCGRCLQYLNLKASPRAVALQPQPQPQESSLFASRADRGVGLI